MTEQRQFQIGDPIFSLYLNLLSHFFENNRELRIKIKISHINFSAQCYDKTCNQSHFLTYESINTCDNAETSCLYSDLVFFPISKLHYRNSNSYFNILLLLSGDIIKLNPGLLCNDQLQLQSEWSVFNSGGASFYPP